MDLKQRIEEFSSVASNLTELQSLNAEVAELKTRIEEAMKRVKVENGKIVNPNDQVFIDRLTALRTDAEKRVAEAATKFNESKTQAVETLRQEVDAELSTYRMAGERGYETQSEAMDRVGNPYMTGKNEVEMKNYERTATISRINEAIEANREKLAEAQAEMDKAIAEGKSYMEIKKLSRTVAAIEADIKIGEATKAKFETPFRAIEDNEVEYNAVYNVVEASTIQATIDALHELEEIQETSIPVETRYKDMQDKAKALVSQKNEAQATIARLKKMLDEGKIGKDYVESTKARITELEQEVKDCEAQEKENADKMKKLEEEHGLKPEKPAKPEKTPMEQYDEMEALKKQTEQQIAEKTADLKKLDEELAEHPEKAEEIKAQKAKLEAELAVLEKGKEAAEKSMTELDTKYKLGRGKGKGDDGKGGAGKGDGTGTGKGDDSGKPKTPEEQLQALVAEQEKLDDALKAKEAEISKKRQEAADEKDPDKSKALSQELAELRKEYDKIRVDKNKVKIQIGTLEKKIKDDEEAAKNGGQKPVPVYGDEYYESQGVLKKAQLKAEAYEAATGTKPGFFKKILLTLPSNMYSKKAADMLTAGQIKPIAGDEELIAKVAEAKAAEAAKAASKGGKAADPLDTLTPEQKAAAQAAAAKAGKDAAAKGEAGKGEGQPGSAKTGPEKDAGDAR